jgi:hypothetical protein
MYVVERLSPLGLSKSSYFIGGARILPCLLIQVLDGFPEARIIMGRDEPRIINYGGSEVSL